MNRALLVFAASVVAIAAAQAADLGYHPALSKTRPTPAGIDASTFIPGHPARGAAGQAPQAAQATVSQAPASAPQAH
ncbi:hypothetical protein [Rubrivivax gelatinosus]|uniref:hypothetical protein n=1 Tax=Rubrivivax gelatinosus TaxID=28068 RepID=UPI0002FA06C3|nr:hypothetical protein [Rubrivivax gelatinosus]MBG6082339.1 hypothetical protein [Rubrivivax gelatinosus]